MNVSNYTEKTNNNGFFFRIIQSDGEATHVNAVTWTKANGQLRVNLGKYTHPKERY